MCDYFDTTELNLIDVNTSLNITLLHENYKNFQLIDFTTHSTPYRKVFTITVQPMTCMLFHVQRNSNACHRHFPCTMNFILQ
jgi:hypothetical protein